MAARPETLPRRLVGVPVPEEAVTNWSRDRSKNSCRFLNDLDKDGSRSHVGERMPAPTKPGEKQPYISRGVVSPRKRSGPRRQFRHGIITHHDVGGSRVLLA